MWKSLGKADPMSSRRSFLKNLGLLGTIPFIPQVFSEPPVEVPKENVLKKLMDTPVQLGISNRGDGTKKTSNAWRDRYYIAEFEPRRCVCIDRLVNGKEVRQYGTCDGYTVGPGMPLACFKPDDGDGGMPQSFSLTMGRFEDGTPMWKDILQYPKFKERDPKLFDVFQSWKNKNQ